MRRLAFRLSLAAAFTLVLLDVGCSDGSEGKSSSSGGTIGSGSATTGGSGVGGAGVPSGGTGGTETGMGGTTGGIATGSSGGTTSGGGGAPTGSAIFSVNVSLSSVIGTVGIAEWSVDVPISAARVRFGREQGSYEYEAPVDLEAPNYRTLLLGMKPSTMYYVQVVAEARGESYTSESYPLTTGPQQNGLPGLTITDEGSGVYEGFTIACTMGLGGPTGSTGRTSYAFIFDRDGDFVWWYELTGEHASCSRARMSFDGKDMWTGNMNVGQAKGQLLRISMDGTEEKAYSFPYRHHDFAVLPNNHILYYESEGGGSGFPGFGAGDGADTIRDLDPDSGTVTDIYDQNTDFSAEIDQYGSHTNAITFVPEQNAISFSMLNFDTIAMVSYPEGKLVSTFGGPRSDWPAMSWNRQHGHEVLDDGIVLFNNNGPSGSSSILRYRTNGTAAELVLDYSAGITSQTFGGVQRLPNGNLLAAYSNAGIIHEISESGQLLRSIDVGGVGYVLRRATLYGPPPPFGE